MTTHRGEIKDPEHKKREPAEKAAMYALCDLSARWPPTIRGVAWSELLFGRRPDGDFHPSRFKNIEAFRTGRDIDCDGGFGSGVRKPDGWRLASTGAEWILVVN